MRVCHSRGGRGMGGMGSPTILWVFRKTATKTNAPSGVTIPSLKNEVPPSEKETPSLKDETPFHEMIRTRSTINNNLESPSMFATTVGNPGTASHITRISQVLHRVIS